MVYRGPAGQPSQGMRFQRTDPVQARRQGGQ
jgi:hypothetical protein